MDTMTAGLGHNAPPVDLKSGAALREDLEQRHADMVTRTKALLESGEAFLRDHERVEDDDTSGVLAGLITQLRGQSKVADTTREGVKAPYLEGTRIVDGFFNGGQSAKLDALAKRLNALQTGFLRVKEERARREAEEKARIAREEEEARKREAQRLENERRQREQEAENRRLEAERQRQREEQARLDAQRKEQEAEAARLAKLKHESDAAERERIEAQAKREREERDAAERQRQEQARREREASEAAARKAQAEADEARRKEEAERQEEARAATERQEAERKAKAGSADLSRVRGDFGMASLRTTWKWELVNLADVPPEFLAVNEAAVNAAIKGENGRHSIPGLRIWPEKTAANR